MGPRENGHLLNAGWDIKQTERQGSRRFDSGLQGGLRPRGEAASKGIKNGRKAPPEGEGYAWADMHRMGREDSRKAGNKIERMRKGGGDA